MILCYNHNIPYTSTPLNHLSIYHILLVDLGGGRYAVAPYTQFLLQWQSDIWLWRSNGDAVLLLLSPEDLSFRAVIPLSDVDINLIVFSQRHKNNEISKAAIYHTRLSSLRVRKVVCM